MTFEYQVIIRPRRKTVSISVKPDCSVRLLIPANLSDNSVAELVKKKTNWIESKIAYFKDVQKLHKEKEYVSGEYFTYLGKNYRLKIYQNDANEEVRLMNGRFNVPVAYALEEGEQTRIIIKRLSKWYQKHALTHLEKKVRLYAKRIGRSPTIIGIKGYTSKFGTCHSDGRIYFNWRIIIAPHPVIDYLVVHELCHLVHHNHSKNFWQLVETILPDYLEREKWLKMNRSELII